MEAKSLGDVLRKAAQQWGDKPAMLYPRKGKYESLSYKDLPERVRSYAGALRSLGLKKGDRVALQSESCIDWALVDWACQSLGIILVPIYPTLPPDQTQFIVNNCGTALVISSTPTQAEKVQGMPGVRVVLLHDSRGSIEELAQNPANQMSEADWNASIDTIEPNDIATIIYTSGTTGPPKGAMLTHRNFTFICESAIQSLPINDRDTFLSFLPMSHVYERVAGQALPISAGATIAYAKSLMTLAIDMRTIRPTIMLCVPRFLEATRDRILDQASKGSFVKKALVHTAAKQCGKAASGQFAPFAWFFNMLVGSRVRGATGGRIRFFVSGGAALAPHVSAFYRGFGLNVLQGYGLTETTAATCVNHPDRNKPWTVGEPIPGVEVKIAPDGEILVRGPSVMAGYYNLPEATQQAVDREGWFHTGDIGEFEGKNLKITDRKKDLLVLANGKNVAPQPIENKLRESPYISEAVLFGDGSEFIYGLIIPNWDHLRMEFKTVEPNSALADQDRVVNLIKSEVSKVNKSLADYERIKRHTILNAEFTVDTGELTPSLKVKRKVVREKFKNAIESLLHPEKDEEKTPA